MTERRSMQAVYRDIGRWRADEGMQQRLARRLKEDRKVLDLLARNKESPTRGTDTD